MTEEKLRIAEHLKTSPLFAALDATAIASLSSLCRVENVAKEAAIVEEGSLGESMYVLMNGRVRVEKRTPAEDRYTVTFLSHENGDFFGELGLLLSDRRSATGISITLGPSSSSAALTVSAMSSGRVT